MEDQKYRPQTCHEALINAVQAGGDGLVSALLAVDAGIVLAASMQRPTALHAAVSCNPLRSAIVSHLLRHVWTTRCSVYAPIHSSGLVGDIA